MHTSVPGQYTYNMHTHPYTHTHTHMFMYIEWGLLMRGMASIQSVQTSRGVVQFGVCM